MPSARRAGWASAKSLSVFTDADASSDNRGSTSGSKPTKLSRLSSFIFRLNRQKSSVSDKRSVNSLDIPVSHREELGGTPVRAHQQAHSSGRRSESRILGFLTSRLSMECSPQTSLRRVLVDNTPPASPQHQDTNDWDEPALCSMTISTPSTGATQAPIKAAPAPTAVATAVPAGPKGHCAQPPDTPTSDGRPRTSLPQPPCNPATLPAAAFKHSTPSRHLHGAAFMAADSPAKELSLQEEPLPQVSDADSSPPPPRLRHVLVGPPSHSAAAAPAGVAAAGGSPRSTLYPELQSQSPSPQPQQQQPPQPQPQQPQQQQQQLLEPNRLLAVCRGAPAAMRRRVWCLEDYSIKERLSKSATSAVYSAVCRYSGLPVALKVYSLSLVPLNVLHMILREIQIQSSAVHPHIVMLYGTFQDMEYHRLVLVQEYAANGDLYGLHRQLGCRMNEDQARELVLRPLLEAVTSLHSAGVVHRDIKPDNILFTSDWRLMLGDFGVAINSSQERAVTRAGTVGFMAPEVERCPLKSRPEDNKHDVHLAYTTAADVWAIGCLGYMLLVGFPPFLGCYSMQAGAGRPPLSFPNSTSPLARDFISCALAEHPHDRPTALQLLRHPWMGMGMGVAGKQARSSGGAAAAAGIP